MEFGNYPAERLAIDSIVSRLDPRENEFRRELIDYGIRHKKPFNVTGNMQVGEMDGHDAKKMAEVLIHKKAMAAAENGDVNFIYPLSLVPTAHHVLLKDGRALFAMCAVDALGTSFTFDQDVRISSKCHQCGTAISVTVENGRIADTAFEDIRVLHVDLNKFENWACSA